MTKDANPVVSASQRSLRIPVLSIGLLVGVALVAANLRAALTGVGPLLPSIQQTTGLNSTGAGVIGTLPLLAFAATSPFVRGAARRTGSSRLLIGALATTSAGIVLRSLPGIGSLIVGTVVLSAGIAVCNVLLPAIIKQSVAPDNIGRVTGLYVSVMGLVAALASGIAVPLANSLPGGWRTSLGMWSLLCLVALGYCVTTRVGTRTSDSPPTASGTPVAVWSSRLAWQVSIFMGLQSIVFYSMISWFPSIVAAHNTSEQTAGWQLTVFQMAGLVTSTAVPLLTRHRRDHSSVAGLSSLVCGVGFAVLLVAPNMAWLAATLIGFGGGSCLVLALSFQGQRAADADAAASLAGMAQAVGYLMAAAAPLALGLLRDISGSWRAALIVLITLTVIQAAFGVAAGRNRQLPSAGDRTPSTTGATA